MTPRAWFHGLLAAFIGSASGAIGSGLGLMVMYPKQFNLGPDVWQTLQTALVLGFITGLQSAFAYLKQSPLWDGMTERRVTTDAQVHTVEVTTEPSQTKAATTKE